MPHNVMEMFYLSPVTEAVIMKTVKNRINIPLAHICHLSFDAGIFPMEIKFAKITPIFFIWRGVYIRAPYI